MDREISKKRLLDFERPRLDTPLYKENSKPHGFGMNQNDGLPAPTVETTFHDTEAPDLTPERFVCMGSLSNPEERPPCRHYKRQLLPSSDKERVIMLRYCAAITDEEGMRDIGNTEVLACEFRDPPDLLSLKKLDAFDEETVRRQEERKRALEPFDPLAALEKEKEKE